MSAKREKEEIFRLINQTFWHRHPSFTSYYLLIPLKHRPNLGELNNICIIPLNVSECLINQMWNCVELQIKSRLIF